MATALKTNLTRFNIRSGKMFSNGMEGTPEICDIASGPDMALDVAKNQKEELLRTYGGKRVSVVENWVEIKPGVFRTIYHFGGHDFFQMIAPTLYVR